MMKPNYAVQPQNVRAELEPVHFDDRCLTPFYQIPQECWNDYGDDEVYSMEEGRKVILLVVGAPEQKRNDVRTTVSLSQK